MRWLCVTTGSKARYAFALRIHWKEMGKRRNVSVDVVLVAVKMCILVQPSTTVADVVLAVGEAT